MIKLEKNEKMTSIRLEMQEKWRQMQFEDEIAAWEMYCCFETHPEWLNLPGGLRVYHTVKDLAVLYNQKLTAAMNPLRRRFLLRQNCLEKRKLFPSRLRSYGSIFCIIGSLKTNCLRML